ncbi:flavin reductase family protein [Alicyclobacillus tolerans]|uniref:flavin reductase family protein n=1 Tax=Alicyclobacillus tolerans TaxID=90970 RepID=UPI001F244278|nr:flavin reductase family protein [Alicyclobacillus tolerans]MCF8567651.1 flavin reductase family protein [Alicyclobacillus tolerans]
MDEQAKKTALRGISYGLYVVGVKNGEDVNASTVNWVTQTSFQPPLVVVAAKAGTTTEQWMDSEKVFSVSVLESGQKDLAFAFFKPMHRVGNKFGDIGFSIGEKTGCPVLDDALSWFECKVVDKNTSGDHTIFIGEVINAGVHRTGNPLTLAETGVFYGG